MQKLRVGLGVLLAALLLTGAGWADDCDRLSAPQYADQRIRACTQAINSGQWTGKNQAINYSNRGNAWKHKQELDKAIADYDMAIQAYPQFAMAYYNRGLAWHAKKEYDKEIADYGKAIELNPNYAEAYGNRAYVLALQGHYKEALADAKRGVELDPEGRTKNRAILEWVQNKAAGK
ncbi:MAG: tetratricopeptide repeat protein [Thermodesulfobacteriota bacterium]